MASASKMGIPAAANIAATVDFPMPIDPVKARLIMAAAYATIRHRGRAACLADERADRQHQTLVEHVRQDLQSGLKKPTTGRNGLDALRQAARIILGSTER